MKRFLGLIMAIMMVLPVIPALASDYEEISKGSKGDAVVILQKRLNELGYSVGKADGDFGGKTVTALENYQTANDLEVTGSLTEETFNAMFGELLGSKDEEQYLHSFNIAPTDSVFASFDFGYFNSNGEIIIPASRNLALPEDPYQSFGSFNEGRAWVQMNDKFGFIDFTGEFVIPCIYDDAGSFSNGLAWAAKDGKGGYIDKNGEVVIPFNFSDGSDFSEGFAVVSTPNAQAIINTSGEIVGKITDKYDDIGDFHDGLAKVSLDLYHDGYINTEGNLVLPTQYENAEDFSDGFAMIGYEDKYYINKNGEKLNIGNYQAASNFNEGLAAVKSTDGLYGYINTEGEIQIPCEYYRAYEFSEGIAMVTDFYGNMGGINAKGEVVIPFELGYGKARLRVSEFHNGICHVSDGSNNEPNDMFINTSGEVIIAVKDYLEYDKESSRMLFTEAWDTNVKNTSSVSVSEAIMLYRALYGEETTNTESQRTHNDEETTNAESQRTHNSATWFTQSECEEIAIAYMKEHLNPYLKNPSSLQINDVTASEVENGQYMFLFTISSMNSFGGYDTDFYGCYVDYTTGQVMDAGLI